jgi:hypothetical protein
MDLLMLISDLYASLLSSYFYFYSKQRYTSSECFAELGLSFLFILINDKKKQSIINKRKSCVSIVCKRHIVTIRKRRKEMMHLTMSS